MRDPARIDRILDQLREVWMQVPDWRLGQLIVNATSPTELIDVHKLFNIEDNKMEKRLAALSKGPANRIVDYVRLGDLQPIVPPEGID